MLGKGVRLRNPELARAASCMQGHCLPPPAPIRRDSRSLFRESCPCSAIPSLPGQAFSWLQLSFLWTSSPLGYIQQCRQLFTAAPGLLFLPDTSVLSFSFELTLPRRHYTFPWESFHLPSCPSPLWCSPRPAFTLGSAFLDSVVFSSGSSWWPITAALLTWMKLTSLLYPPVYNDPEAPRLLTVDGMRPRSHKCDKSPHIPTARLLVLDTLWLREWFLCLPAYRAKNQLAMSPCLLLHQASMNPTVTLRVYIASGKFAQHS